MINEAVLKELLEGAPAPAEKARLLSSRLGPPSVVLAIRHMPCVGLGLWLQPGNFRAAVQPPGRGCPSVLSALRVPRLRGAAPQDN